MTDDTQRQRKFTRILVAYPVVLILIALAANLFSFGVAPISAALPATEIIFALAAAAVLLVANHTWLMTSTELTRLKYGMQATPEEWDEGRTKREDVSPEGWRELERRHNAHRNATENTVYFVLLALIVSITSPTILAAQVWILAFAIARLGYTFCYLKGMSGARGLFMSLSLLSIYGLASYLAVGLFL